MSTSSSTIVLITGANTGIGLETVRALLKSPSATVYQILLGARDVQRGLDAATMLAKEVPETKSAVEVVQIDVQSDESIEALYGAVKDKYGRVDVLINNAGLSPTERPDTLSCVLQLIKSSTGVNLDGHTLKLPVREAWARTYDVNVVGTQILTTTFVPLLLASSSPRLIFLTSGLSSLAGASQKLITYIPFGGVPAGWPKTAQFAGNYRSSKAALNMMMVHWYHLLYNDGVKVWCVSPGFLATGLMVPGEPDKMKAMGAGDAAIGGLLLRKVVEGERDADVGKVVSQAGVQAW